LTVRGKPVGKLWGMVDASGTVRRAPQADVLAPVWLIDPQQGATVGRTVRVFIAAEVFEATVRLRIRSAAGSTVVDRQVVVDTRTSPRGSAVVQETLAPGKYTVEAFFLSERDGSVQGVDNHDITVN
jgi:hypothetical protein